MKERFRLVLLYVLLIPGIVGIVVSINQLFKLLQSRPANAPEIPMFVLENTVKIISLPPNKSDSFSQGTGMWIGNGLIITNLHILKGGKNYIISYNPSDWITWDEVNIVSSSSLRDLAVLRVKDSTTTKQFMNRSVNFSSGPYNIGETAYLVGNPFPEDFTAVKAKLIGRTLITFKDRTRQMLVIKNPELGPGFSGSGLFLPNGEVIGILEMCRMRVNIITGEIGESEICLAIPSEEIIEWLSRRR